MLEHIATPVADQVLVFATQASGAQVEQYYLDLLGPQGWKRDAIGGISELTTCPKLWVVITPEVGDGVSTTYRIKLQQERCADYC